MRDLSIADIEFIVIKDPVFVESLRASSEELFSLLYCFADPSIDRKSKEHIAHSLATNDDHRKILFPELKRLLPQRTVDDVKDVFDTMSDGDYAYVLPKDGLPLGNRYYDDRSFTYANGKDLVQSIVELFDPIVPPSSLLHSYLLGGGSIASKFPPEIEAIKTGIKMSFVLTKDKSLSMLGLLLEVAYGQEGIYPIIINNVEVIYKVFDHITNKKRTFREVLMNADV